MKILPFELNSLANMLSVTTVKHKLRITMDRDLDPSIHVHLKEGTRIMFKKWSRGLYYYDKTNK